MGKWPVVGWSVVGGSVVGGFNKSPCFAIAINVCKLIIVI